MGEGESREQNLPTNLNKFRESIVTFLGILLSLMNLPPTSAKVPGSTPDHGF